ncbi:MAG: ABC transporter substrate-binding protein [Patescibacteria group bacterium]
MNSLKKKILPKYNKAKRKLVYSGYYLKNKFLRNKKHSDLSDDLDQKLVYSFSSSKLPGLRQLKHLKKVLSNRDLWLIRLFLLFILLNVVWLGYDFWNKHLEKVPVAGGEYTEGIIGSPRYINPLYNSINEVDKDISGLIYSSLYKYNNNGELVEDVVAEAEKNKEATEYVFHLKEDIEWHNGGNLTADDVVFTFNAIKDPAYNSPIRTSFSGVEAEKVGEYSVKFKLSSPYAPFKELLTFGILPRNSWEQIPPSSANLAELNLKPIGSGPFEFDTLVKDKLGNIISYELTANDSYYGGNSYVEEIKFDFFVNYIEAINALNRNEIDGVSGLPPSLKDELASRDSLRFHDLKTAKINSIFFDQEKNPALKNKNVREALAYAVNRKEIINEVFGGYAEPAYSPIPSSSPFHETEVSEYEYDLNKAKELLKEAEWEEFEVSQQEISELEEKREKIKKQTEAKENEEPEGEEEEEAEEEEVEELTDREKAKLGLGAGSWLQKEEDKYLSLELSVADEDQNRKAAEKIKEAWEGIGVKVALKVISSNDVNNVIVNSRDFEAVFHAQTVNDESDIYAFWHSSQAGNNGLNISNYENEEVDELLKNSRVEPDKKKREQNYKQFQKIITQEVPAIFVYSPDHLYVQSSKVNGYNVANIGASRHRFSNISDWYIKTGEKLVW